MDVGTTEMAVIGAAVVGAYKALDGAIAIIKVLVSKNGKNGNGQAEKEPTTQAMLEQRLLGMIDKFDSQKTNKEICDERHLEIAKRLEDGAAIMADIRKDQSAMASNIAVIATKLNGG